MTLVDTITTIALTYESKKKPWTLLLFSLFRHSVKAG